MFPPSLLSPARASVRTPIRFGADTPAAAKAAPATTTMEANAENIQTATAFIDPLFIAASADQLQVLTVGRQPSISPAAYKILISADGVLYYASKKNGVFELELAAKEPGAPKAKLLYGNDFMYEADGKSLLLTHKLQFPGNPDLQRSSSNLYFKTDLVRRGVDELVNDQFPYLHQPYKG